ncbi:hypothetical protein [Acinetobacter johnsonii]|jgi:hypothetical protein|uniref:Uncharacterized protein n=2 Tax=Acinetobacter johnsonii TaxID=40214 RepID=A0A2W5TBT7_ACIJO|nr:hypothetical protein [Acinetobacter johnsonii]EEY95696.1 hypothetical protein HMPREF0016_02109 [Acinetobacter johnsonii SH046]MDH0656261.1 hypothetical protein [Acinetobacter johnsonii]MDH2045568.1 hypothetical protein [Acinetobacter johnsonii]PZQ93127.1 MAG: hypothetical protein DI542_03060 [Acinetobacter johnsonii]QQT57812.1 hypothetical protein I6I50_16120 [Acinetobacter johnsonii]
MIRKLSTKLLKLFSSTYIVFFILTFFIIINILYLSFGEWLIESKIPESTLNLIASLLSASATTFAAITAAVLVLNWKSQHNLSLISKLITEIWELHGQFTSKIYVLTYTFSIETKESEYKYSYAELIEIAVPLRSKVQQLQVLLEGQIDEKNWEFLQDYLNYLEMFYPWCNVDFLEFRDNRTNFDHEFKCANSALLSVCREYISLK